MTINEQLLEAARQWILASTGLANDRVIPVDDDGPRPKKAYLAVGLPTFGVTRGSDEQIRTCNEDTGALEESILSHKTGVIRVTGFGRGMADLIETADSLLMHTTIVELNCTNKISLVAATAIQDLNRYLEAKGEAVWQKDFNIEYAVLVTPNGVQSIASMETLELEMTFESGVASDRTVTITTPS